MSETAKLSHTAALILQTIDNGCSYGFDIMDETGLPSGTVYPALRRMEGEGLIASQWESEEESFGRAAARPQILSRHAPRNASSGAVAKTLSFIRKAHSQISPLEVLACQRSQATHSVSP